MELYHLGSRIKAARTSKGLTQQEFARQLGVSSNHVASIEIGDSLPRLPLLKKNQPRTGCAG